MYIEITFFALLSTLLLFGFIILGVGRFGLLGSYSAYSSKWGKAVPMNNMNLWTMVTLVAAFALCPALLEIGAASALQFLGFLTPVYLIVVSLTPDWQTDRTQYIIHMVFAALCFAGGLAWMLLVMRGFGILCGVAAFVLTLALLSGTQRSSAVFWTEMLMFASVYLAVLLAVL